MKIQINGFIHYSPPVCEGAAAWHFWPCDMSEIGYVTVMPFSIEVDIPAEFDPRGKMVEMLQEKKREVMADFQKRITDIDA